MTAPSSLRKRSLEGKLYVRFPGIEKKLEELVVLPHGEIQARCAAEEVTDPEYIPSECLMYLVRANRDSTPGVYFETVYKALLRRVMKQLPPEDDGDLTQSEIRAEVLGVFAELLARDRLNYEEGLDYFEIRFKGAVANLRRNAARTPTRLKNDSRPLEANLDDPDSGEFSPKIEKAAGCMDFEKYFASHDRAKLAEAISTLPEHQIAILEMLKNEIPIDSEDPNVLTISKVLGKAEKTIRLQRNQAVKKLAEILRKGEV